MRSIEQSIAPAAHCDRRQMLRGMASTLVAANALARDVAFANTSAPASPTRFTRLFAQLPPFAPATPQVRAALLDIGRPGGVMDANDNLAAGPAALILDPALSLNNPNAALPDGVAGTTFMGQFIDHDMTFDVGSRLGVPTDPRRSINARMPALDLDSLYGAGPVADPLLYERSDRIKFRLESGGRFEDLPRTADGGALIADPRNDENLVIAGLHAAFLKFHNRAVDHVRASGETDAATVFARARRLLTWHYQWIVVHEILPSFIGQRMTNELLYQRSSLRRDDDAGDRLTAMPVEFQGAAYRFGHSMVRPSYRANLRGDNHAAFFAMVFDPAAEGQPDPVDLRGGCRAPRRFIGWQTFFDFGDGEARPRKRLDTRISTPLFHLPLGSIPDGTQPQSLPQRNLLRQLTWGLPSGQRIAEALRVPMLRGGDFAELSGYGVGFERSTPLWYYVLKEAELIGGGQLLGPVGGRIVGEVIVGLLRGDRQAWLAAAPEWTPTLPSRYGAGQFRMIDLLIF
ncbi:MAG TPA: peroxidase family protein, partial [Burkholderiaceae bacterium]|nr:peroxidase family protein [Burkholderiaceae bacterium]